MEPAEDDEGDIIPELNNYRGVVLQRERDDGYVSHPPNLNDKVVAAALKLDVPILMTMSSGVTSALVRQAEGRKQFHDVSTGITMPILDSVAELASGSVSVSNEFFICLCKEEQMALVWGHTVCHA